MIPKKWQGWVISLTPLILLMIIQQILKSFLPRIPIMMFLSIILYSSTLYASILLNEKLVKKQICKKINDSKSYSDIFKSSPWIVFTILQVIGVGLSFLRVPGIIVMVKKFINSSIMQYLIVSILLLNYYSDDVEKCK